MSTVGLLGTAFTMEQSIYSERMADHGIDTLVPQAEDRRMVHQVIYDDLCRGIVTQGIILGCTEIELLIRPEDVDIPVFPTTRLQVEAAVERALAG